MPTCTVTLRNRRGVPYWVTTAGSTLFEACASALDFFERDFWRGPRPRPETVLEVHVVGSHDEYRVRASRVREWMAKGRSCQSADADPFERQAADRKEWPLRRLYQIMINSKISVTTPGGGP